MTAAQIRFLSLVRREVNRFLKIKRQTVGAPLLETFLYISVFGAALGSRINELHGFDYVVFVIPGLIMMAWAINAFSNNSSSILQQKFQRAIDDQLSSPASPLELLLAFSLGGFLRGMIVATLTFTAASFLVDLPVEHVARAWSRRCSSSASSSPSSACSSACAPSSSTTCRSRRRSCSSR